MRLDQDGPRASINSRQRRASPSRAARSTAATNILLQRVSSLAVAAGRVDGGREARGTMGTDRSLERGRRRLDERAPRGAGGHTRATWRCESGAAVSQAWRWAEVVGVESPVHVAGGWRAVESAKHHEEDGRHVADDCQRGDELTTLLLTTKLLQPPSAGEAANPVAERG